MANTADRLNQLQQYMDFYNQHHFDSQGSGSNYDRQRGEDFTQQAGSLGPSAMRNWAEQQQQQQQNQQNMEDQNSMFKGMYGGNAQSQFGAPPAYVQPQNQQQQPNPYSARAMQLNGGGQNGGNTLADMFRNYNKGG